MTIRPKRLTVSHIILMVLFAGCAGKQPVPPSSGSGKVIHQPAARLEKSTQTLLNQAYDEWHGVPHKDGGLSKDGIDCSGFVHVVFRDTLQQTLPRTTRTLAATGAAIPQHQLRPGDLVLFKIRNKVNHVGIYTGDDQFIHASKSRGVFRSQLSLPYWQDHYWQSRRVSP